MFNYWIYLQNVPRVVAFMVYYERTVLSEAPNEMMLPKRLATCTHSKRVSSEFLCFMRHQKSSSENSPCVNDKRAIQLEPISSCNDGLCFDAGQRQAFLNVKTRLQALSWFQCASSCSVWALNDLGSICRYLRNISCPCMDVDEALCKPNKVSTAYFWYFRSTETAY